MKYYYTDPIAAAWMAKRFGMIFADRQLPEDLSRYEALMSALDDGGYHGGSRIYIHPDSLQLLEPILGDVVEYGVHNCTYVGEMPTAVDRVRWTKQLGYKGMEDVIHPDKQYVRRIIQRDGKPFFWPEAA